MSQWKLSITSFSGAVIVTHYIDHELGVNQTAFLLAVEGKVHNDSGIIYYNKPKEADGTYHCGADNSDHPAGHAESNDTVYNCLLGAISNTP